MDIDPADAAALKLPVTDERNDLSVRNDRRLIHLLVGRQQLRAPSSLADQELSEDQRMSHHLVASEEAIQLRGVRPAIRQEANPHRGVDQHHHPTRRLPEAFSRRRGTSRASGSDPRRARRRSWAACRTSASRPRRTVSVSVAAPQAALASFSSFSSMCRVFFIHTKLPYRYGCRNAGGRLLNQTALCV